MPQYLLLTIVAVFSIDLTNSVDIDLQTCINNFDIHRDKIIRTLDSQNMGAKYLNEFDLGTREECLRLCCETNECDVFVFEERNSGSCYLFHCGPPENFKCKFTHHVNYSSAVLAINRHLPDLESQIKLTKHEQDLNKLRKSDDVISEPETVRPATTTPPPPLPITTVKSKEVLPGAMQESIIKKPVAETRIKCSRYQFECRSTSECIAIYNACDGIPQCADGSDEAPELGCPSDAVMSAPTTAPPVYPPAMPKMQQYEQNPRFLHPVPPPIVSQAEVYRPPPQQQVAPANDFLLHPRNNLQQFDNRQPYMLPQSVLQSNPNWNAPQIANPAVGANGPPSAYADKNSHIFTHKENGLQVADRGQEISQMQYDSQVYNNPKLGNYYNYRPVENWQSPPEDPQFLNTAGGYAPQQMINNIDSVGKQSGGGLKTTSNVIDHPFGSNKENPKHEQDKMAHELKQHRENSNGIAQDAKIKIEKPKQIVNNNAGERYLDVVAYKVDDHADGFAETPSGAVLSLTLGLIITCIMALLIACRLRVKRRMRKSGKSYAHDADYLVNGMYL